MVIKNIMPNSQNKKSNEQPVIKKTFKIGDVVIVNPNYSMVIGEINKDYTFAKCKFWDSGNQKMRYYDFSLGRLLKK